MSPNLKAEHGKNSLELSRQNEHKVLIQLERFGWLPMSQIHAYCWPSNSTPRSAQRTLANLLAQNQVTFRTRAKSREKVYALTGPGAARLNLELGIDALVLNDLQKSVDSSAFAHRCLANDIAVWWYWAQEQNGGAFFTEHEVITGRAPFRSAPLTMTHAKGKIPDGVLSMPSRDPESPYTKWYGWVEVERGWKNKADQASMVAHLCDILALHQTRWEIGTKAILKFAMVACPLPAHETRLTSELRAFLDKHGHDYDVAYIRKFLYVWRPDGTAHPVGELMAEGDARLAADAASKQDEAAQRALAEVRAVAEMHARLREENGVA